METERRKQALRTLQPAVRAALQRHSRPAPNLVYRLTPFDAYQRNLVKQIEVYGRHAA